VGSAEDRFRAALKLMEDRFATRERWWKTQMQLSMKPTPSCAPGLLSWKRAARSDETKKDPALEAGSS